MCVIYFIEAYLGTKTPYLEGPRGRPESGNRPTPSLHSSYYNIFDTINDLLVVFLGDISPPVPLWYVKPRFSWLGDFLRKFIIHFSNKVPELNTIF